MILYVFLCYVGMLLATRTTKCHDLLKCCATLCETNACRVPEDAYINVMLDAYRCKNSGMPVHSACLPRGWQRRNPPNHDEYYCNRCNPSTSGEPKKQTEKKQKEKKQKDNKKRKATASSTPPSTPPPKSKKARRSSRSPRTPLAKKWYCSLCTFMGGNNDDSGTTPSPMFTIESEDVRTGPAVQCRRERAAARPISLLIRKETPAVRAIPFTGHSRGRYIRHKS